VILQNPYYAIDFWCLRKKPERQQGEMLQWSKTILCTCDMWRQISKESVHIKNAKHTAYLNWSTDIFLVSLGYYLSEMTSQILDYSLCYSEILPPNFLNSKLFHDIQETISYMTISETHLDSPSLHIICNNILIEIATELQ
jgi:hypothetical protein